MIFIYHNIGNVKHVCNHRAHAFTKTYFLIKNYADTLESPRLRLTINGRHEP